MENKLGGGRGACVPVRSTEWNMGRIGGGEEERKRRREREQWLAAHWDSITSEEDQNFVSCLGHGFRFSMNLV